MTEQANRIDWLERQLAQVDSFVKRDKQRLQEAPGKTSIRLSLDSWLTHQEELKQELRQAKEALQHEVVEMRLFGRRMDGSIPLRLLSGITGKLNAALAHAAYHLRHGQPPGKHRLANLQEEIDLRLSGLAFGSTRLVFAGNISPDMTGESPLEGALEQIFDVLAAPSQEKTRELVAVIGVPATKALCELLGMLEKQSIGAEITWPAPNAKVYKWGGNLSEVRSAHLRLSAVDKIEPTPITLIGHITQLRETGAFYIRGEGQQQYKISYSKQQYPHVQQYTLGLKVEVKAMCYLVRDPLTDVESATYKLITED